MQETQVRSLSQEDPLDKEMATHSNILAWEIPWTEEPGAWRSPWGCKESGATKQQQLCIQDITGRHMPGQDGQHVSPDIFLVCCVIPLFSWTINPNHKSDNRNSALFLVWSLDNSWRSNLDKTDEEVTFGFLCVPFWGFPGGSDGKESACQRRRCGFDPRIRKIPWRRRWQPAPVFLPGKSHGQRSLVGSNTWGCKSIRHNLVTKQQTYFIN